MVEVVPSCNLTRSSAFPSALITEKSRSNEDLTWSQDLPSSFRTNTRPNDAALTSPSTGNPGLGLALARNAQSVPTGTIRTVIDPAILECGPLRRRSDNMPPPKSSQGPSIVTDKLPNATHAASSPGRRSSLLSANPRISKPLKPIGSFMDEFKEIARLATQQHRLATNGRTLSFAATDPQLCVDISHVNCKPYLSSPGLLSFGHRPTGPYSRSQPGNMLTTIVPSDPSGVSDGIKPKVSKPRYALSKLRKPSHVPRPNDNDSFKAVAAEIPAVDDSSSAGEFTALHSLALTDNYVTYIDIIAALRPQTSQVILDLSTDLDKCSGLAVLDHVAEELPESLFH